MNESGDSKHGDMLVEQNPRSFPLTTVKFLEQQEIRYAVMGRIALSQWGITRATFDIDIKVPVRFY